MVRKNKHGTYEHFCLLIFGQGKWGKTDSDSIRKQLISLREQIKEDIYNLYLKLTYRNTIPVYSDCQICQPIYNLFQELKGNSDGLIYQGHHWIDSDDLIEMKKMVALLISNKTVKKIYILYLDSFPELKKNAISQMNVSDLKNLLNFKKIAKSDFIEDLNNNKFIDRTVYEIVKDSYF